MLQVTGLRTAPVHEAETGDKYEHGNKRLILDTVQFFKPLQAFFTFDVFRGRFTNSKPTMGAGFGFI